MRCGTYLQPRTREELTQALAGMTEDSVLLAGGTDLIIQLRSRHRELDCMVSLCRAEDMRGIWKEEGFWRIGAMETHASIAGNPGIQKELEALAEACGHVGSAQVRNKGTIGGSLGNASAAGDLLPVLCLYHSLVELLDARGNTRRVPAEDFTTGIGETVLACKEAILAVWIPEQGSRRSCFVKLGGRREVTIAEISLCLSWEEKEGHFSRIEAVMGAVDTKPVFLPEADEILGGTEAGEKEKNELAARLSARIQAIRQGRKRQPRLRILECERVYKERAVKGVVYDAVERMLGRP